MDDEIRKPRWDIFISYARKDDERFAEKLRDDLIDAGKKVWWDKKAMESRSRSFLLEIRDAIWDTERVIAVIGPQALKSDYVWYEWRYAYHLAKALVPVLRLGDLKSISKESKKLLWRDEFERQGDALDPSKLERLHCIDFSDDGSYEQAFIELNRILDSELLPLAPIYPKTLQFPPPNYLPRPDLIQKLSKLLNVDAKQPRSLKLNKRITVVQGRGGLGKSVLANSFVHTIQTRWAFTDGIIWLHIGRNASEEKLWTALKRIGVAFEQDTNKYYDIETAQQLVNEILEPKRCLIIIDDIWDSKHARLFQEIIGPGCCLLITTRDQGIATSLDARLLSLEKEPFSITEAQQLLADWAGQTRESLPVEAKKVIKICGRQPLALAICGAIIKNKESSWTRLPDALLQAKERVLETSIPDYAKENIDVFTPIKVSLEYLKELDKNDRKSAYRYQDYVDLAVLPENEKAPDAVISTLWMVRRSMDEDLTFKYLGQLNGRALIELLGEHPYAEVMLHSLHHSYIRSLVNKTDWINLNAEFGKALLYTWQTTMHLDERELDETEQDEARTYCVDSLFYHLKEGNCWSELKTLLGDVNYLNRKQNREAQHSLEKDIALLICSNTAPVTDILNGALDGIYDNMPLSIAQADWLDTFGYWLNTYGRQAGEWRSPELHSVSLKFDSRCGVVSEKLVDKFFSENKPDYALRFAELRSWVYQRSEDFENCVKACHDAEMRCADEGLDIGYQTLGKVEFIRMRAHALSALAMQENNSNRQKELLEKANMVYRHLSKEFSQIGEENWCLSTAEWKLLEQDSSIGFQLDYRKSKDDTHLFETVVVSNAHDAISALYIIQYLESKGAYVQWIHHSEFKTNYPGLANCRLAILIGGPKSPGISEVAQRFYLEDKERYLRMYSGLHFGPEILKATIEGVQYYMIGGISKAHTLLAAYKITENKEVSEIINEMNLN